MKILMLVNWKIEYTDRIPPEEQPPDYVVPEMPYWFFRYFEREVQVDVVDIRSFPALEAFEKSRIRFYLWQTLKVLPRLGRYDVVLSHGMQSGIVLCLFRRLFGKGSYKHVVFDIGAFNSARESGKALKLMQFASRTLDGVIYHTSGQRSYYEKCHPWLLDRSRFIPFGTDTEFFAGKGPERQEEEQGSEKEQYILCIGYHKRDWETLFKAFALVRTNVRLRMIGNDALVCQDERVEILPPVPVRELQEQMSGSLFGVLPLRSFNYSFGQMTLLQQMAMGKAVIAADVPSLRDYVEDGRTAVCYEPEKERQLAEKIEMLLKDPGLREEIAENARKAVARRFSEPVMAERIEKYINDVLDKG